MLAPLSKSFYSGGFPFLAFSFLHHCKILSLRQSSGNSFMLKINNNKVSETFQEIMKPLTFADR